MKIKFKINTGVFFLTKDEEEISPDDSVSQYVLSTEIQYTPSKCLR